MAATELMGGIRWPGPALCVLGVHVRDFFSQLSVVFIFPVLAIVLVNNYRGTLDAVVLGPGPVKEPALLIGGLEG